LVVDGAASGGAGKALPILFGTGHWLA